MDKLDFVVKKFKSPHFLFEVSSCFPDALVLAVRV